MRVFLTGGTGYMGRPFAAALRSQGHEVDCLARASSVGKIRAGCRPIIGDALDASTYRGQLTGEHTFVHLVGVSHPSPARAKQFREVDLPALQEAVGAAKAASIRHFVYVSVAHPAPVMKAYIAVREECEATVTASGLRATILRPWYVLGPGHWWPIALLPLYSLAEHVPSLGEGARRLRPVVLSDIVRTLVWSVENPLLSGVRVLDVEGIRTIGGSQTEAVEAGRLAI
jgi:uncharacterized protein YbjT (DUF2867 family)